MNQPGNHEITTADLALGELPYALPLEGWSGMTLHCQVDAIGPSDRHPDLVKLEVSFPPVARSQPAPPHAQPGINCPTCGTTTTEQHPRRPKVLRCVNCIVAMLIAGGACALCVAVAARALRGLLSGGGANK